MREHLEGPAAIQTGVFDRLVAVFGAARDRTPEAAFQRRFLVGCAIIGLGVTLISIGQALSNGPLTSVWLLIGFGVAVVLLALLLRLGVDLDRLIWANLGLLAVFFFLASIQTEAFHAEQLGWLVLLPLIAALGARPSPRKSSAALVATFVLALGIGGAIVVAHEQGWTLRQPVASTPWSEFAEFVPLLLGVSTIVWLFARLLQRVELENRTLRGLLPVCAWCHQIRDASGNWLQVDRFLHDRGASITHVICPPCFAKIPPEGS